MNWLHYIENQKLCGEHRLPGRSLLLPADREGITHENYTDSPHIIPLDGDWKFCYLPEKPDKALWDTDTNDSEWDILPVPSMWQYHGYGHCVYPNVCYPFPYDPPYIKYPNPVGIYRRHFDLAPAGEGDGRLLLRFLGVDNAFFVFINGFYCGFAKGSRIASEFDVTNLTHAGDNLITVVVFTWSDASYLENQDMLLSSGIFRDVYLIREGKSSLWDYTAVPEAQGFRIWPELSGVGNTVLHLSLRNREGLPVCEADFDGTAESVFLPIAEPHRWNAEDPYLYTLILTVIHCGVISEIHTKRIGLRHSEIVGNQLLLNGKPLFIKGVNRHDNDPREGKALTVAQIRRDLEDIKACNLNAIRTSHYTQHPAFYEISSELGLYIMDEADAETHGAHVTGDQGALNKNPDWYPAFYDRISRMYLQGKNETCVNLRSPGNECGEGDSFDSMADWLLEQKAAVPVHFPPYSDHAREVTGFRMTGYMPMQVLRDYTEEGKPVIMTEYAHAMGNSPGALADIWKYIYTHPWICGGYVWEYRSHGFYTPGKDGKARYLYGGDFGDKYHWSNFSLDGYHTSDGTPKPAWDELREVSAPVYAELNDDVLTVYNTYDFTSINGVHMNWTVRNDGVAVRTGTVILEDIAPHTHKEYTVDVSCDGLHGLVTVDYVFTGGSCEIGHKQFILRDTEPAVPTHTAFEHNVTQTENGKITVATPRGQVVFANGLPVSIVSDGTEHLSGSMQVNLWRATTDNDGIVNLFPRHMGEWMGALLHTAAFWADNVQITDTLQAVTITAVGKVVPQSVLWGFTTTITYTLTAEGMKVRVTGTPFGSIPEILPRIGVVFPLTSAHTHCRWIGRGDSYPDRQAASPVGLYDCAVSDMNFLYDVPQETGNHTDTVSVCAYGPAAGSGLTVKCDAAEPRRFCFSCHDFTLDNLTAARHGDELITTPEKYLYIDYAVRGLGSLSCGPDPEQEYELKTAPFEFRFAIEI